MSYDNKKMLHAKKKKKKELRTMGMPNWMTYAKVFKTALSWQHYDI